MFKSLKSYRQELMLEAYEKGYPLMRYMYLQYPNDPNTLQLMYQYMFGPDLLIAPIVSPNTFNKTVYLPSQNNWLFVWSEQIYYSQLNNYVTVEAPIGHPPVFIRLNQQNQIPRESLNSFLEFIRNH